MYCRNKYDLRLDVQGVFVVRASVVCSGGVLRNPLNYALLEVHGRGRGANQSLIPPIPTDLSTVLRCR